MQPSPWPHARIAKPGCHLGFRLRRNLITRARRQYLSIVAHARPFFTSEPSSAAGGSAPAISYTDPCRTRSIHAPRCALPASQRGTQRPRLEPTEHTASALRPRTGIAYFILAQGAY
ncbi:hypothetical protein PsYK624_111920 [Phanerochaete sordida]|uniref:Uncharacterized protein n=1 Tax=Phanerochaete sordida TaxID=48140 RepID=A0A9P3GFD3_9APHY|nr:hypothetical protein PsYK624_111920 [Phanerochaete sordida]